MVMNFEQQATVSPDAGSAQSISQEPSSPSQADNGSSSTSDYSQQFANNNADYNSENQASVNQPNVQQEQNPSGQQSQKQANVDDNDTFEQYFDMQNPNIIGNFQNPNQLYQEQQPQYHQAPQQQFQNQQFQQQNQQQFQEQQPQNQTNVELFDDFQKVVEHAQSIDSFDLGLSQDEIVDLLDKDPVNFANTLVKTAVSKALEMVGKFDISSVIEQNSMDSIQKYAHQQMVHQKGQEFVNQASQELIKNNIFVNDATAGMIYSHLAQNVDNDYNTYKQFFTNAKVMGNLENSKVPHNNGQMLSKQEYALKSVVMLGKNLSRTNQSQPRQFNKVTTNQAMMPNQNSQSGVTKDFSQMTDEEFLNAKKNMGF